MSEYYDDKDIRLYTPVLQRVIILLAVIIAVPVAMWTITTVVRTYVAPPKLPTFQRLTDSQPTDTVSSTTPAPAPAAPPSPQMADAQAAAAQARTALLDIKKPPALSQPVSAAPAAMTAPAPAAAPVAASVPAPVAAPSPPPVSAQPTAAAPTPGMTAAAAATPAGTTHAMAASAVGAPAAAPPSNT